MKYYKIVDPNGNDDGLLYKEGINTAPFDPKKGFEESGGILFSKKHILALLGHGTDLYEVEPLSKVYKNWDKGFRMFKAKKVKLTYVGKTQDIKILEKLIKEGADVNANMGFPLFWTVKMNYRKIAKFLLENGADVHIDEDNPLRFAAACGSLNMVKLFLEKGADIHADGDGALRLAAQGGLIKMVKFLVEQGADVNSKYDKGNALEFASMHGQTEVVKFLLEKGAKKQICLY
jgi:hypothetical protein